MQRKINLDLSQIKKNSFYFFLISFTRIFGNAIILIIIARLFGSLIYGSFASALTLSTIFLTIADFGFDFLLVTELAKKENKQEEVFFRFLPYKFILLSIAFISLILISFTFKSSDLSTSLISVFSFYMLFGSLSNFNFAFLRGINVFKYEAYFNLFNGILSIISVYVFFLFGFSIIAIAILLSSFKLLLFLGSFSIIKKHIVFFPNKFISPKFNKDFKKVAVFGTNLIFGLLFFQLDTVLLLYIKGDEIAGIYQSAFRIMALFLVLPEIIIWAILPLLTRFLEVDEEKFFLLLKMMARILFTLAIPICMGLLVFPKLILILIYSRDEFLQAAPLLQIMALIILIRFIDEVYALILTVSNKQKIRAKIASIATVINLTLNLLLIPNYGIIAAVYASLITNLVVALIYFIKTFAYVKSSLFELKQILFLLVPTIFYLIINYFNYSNSMLALFSSTIFLLILGFYVNFNKIERSMILEMKYK